MRVLVDKSVIWCGCIVMALLPGPPGAAGIAWLLGAVAVSGACTLTESTRAAAVAPTAYLVLAALSPWSLSGAPLLVHDLFRTVTVRSRGAWLLPACCIPVLSAVTRHALPPSAAGLSAVVCALAAALAVRTAQGEATRQRLYVLRDDLQEKVGELRASNARLLETQDHETRAAALSERTRIAREIHDTVGHLLTRLVLQTKALQLAHRDEPAVVAELGGVNVTLNEALDSMRRSVHALSDEGEDLATSLNVLGSRCGIENVAVRCTLDREPPPAISRCLIAVAREALTNAARHGRADSARVVLAEYPVFWQITIGNDGAAPAPERLHNASGMGLRSMRERIESLGGVLRITTSPRFTVFATLPKENP